MMPKPRVVMSGYVDQRKFWGHVDNVRNLNTTKGDEQFQPSSFEIRISTTGFGRFSEASITGSILYEDPVTGVVRPRHWDRHTRTYGRWDNRNIPPGGYRTRSVAAIGSCGVSKSLMRWTPRRCAS